MSKRGRSSLLSSCLGRGASGAQPLPFPGHQTPGCPSRSATTPRSHQPSAGLGPGRVRVGAPGRSLHSGRGFSPRAPAAAAMTAGPTRACGHRAALLLAVLLGPGAGRRPRLGCHWPLGRRGRFPAAATALSRAASARPAKPARGRLARTQLRRGPGEAGADPGPPARETLGKQRRRSLGEGAGSTQPPGPAPSAGRGGSGAPGIPGPATRRARASRWRCPPSLRTNRTQWKPPAGSPSSLLRPPTPKPYSSNPRKAQTSARVGATRRLCPRPQTWPARLPCPLGPVPSPLPP